MRRSFAIHLSHKVIIEVRETLSMDGKGFTLAL